VDSPALGELINHADMGGVADLNCDALDDVWSDECRRIVYRLGRRYDTPPRYPDGLVRSLTP
jgi:hypothetical protein